VTVSTGKLRDVHFCISLAISFAAFQLYRVSKEALSLIENQFLFTSHRPLKLAGADYPGVFSAEMKRYSANKVLRHGVLMGTVYWLTITMFVALAGYFSAVHEGWSRLPLPSAVAGRSK
jgi:hypothetical protein